MIESVLKILHRGRQQARGVELFSQLMLESTFEQSLEPIDSGRLAVFFGSDFLSLLDTETKLSNKILYQFARHLGRRLRGTVVGQSTEQAL